MKKLFWLTLFYLPWYSVAAAAFGFWRQFELEAVNEDRKAKEINELITRSTGGLMRDAQSLVRAFTTGLASSLPAKFNRRVRVKLSETEDLGNIYRIQGVAFQGSFFEITFGCAIFLQGKKDAVKSDCVPAVYIDEVKLPVDLRNKGVSTRLLGNIVKLLEKIRDRKKSSPPLILVDAISRIIENQDMRVRSMTGAEFWARKGFNFLSDRERDNLIDNFLGTTGVCIDQIVRRGLTEQIELTREGFLKERVKTPLDLLELDLEEYCGPLGKDIGKRFFRTGSFICWLGKMVIEESDEGYRRFKSSLSQKNVKKCAGPSCFGFMGRSK